MFTQNFSKFFLLSLIVCLFVVTPDAVQAQAPAIAWEFSPAQKADIDPNTKCGGSVTFTGSGSMVLPCEGTDEELEKLFYLMIVQDAVARGQDRGNDLCKELGGNCDTGDCKAASVSIVDIGPFTVKREDTNGDGANDKCTASVKIKFKAECGC